MEHCSKEGELSSIRTEVNDLKKIVKGNGQKGLQQNVFELNAMLPELKISVDTLAENVKQLNDSRLLAEGARAEKMSAKQKLAAIITGIIGAAAVIVMVVDLIIKYKETI